MGTTLHIHSLARLVHFHIAAIRNIERSIKGNIQLILCTLCSHFGFRRAVAPNEFILAVHRHIRVHRSCVNVDIASILRNTRNTREIRIITICLAMRHPAPVTWVFSQRSRSREIIRREIPLISRFTIKFLVRSFVHQVLMRRPRTTMVKAHIKANTARSLDGCGPQFQREIPLPCSGSRIIGILDLFRLNIAQGTFQLFLGFFSTFTIEPGFVIVIANIRSHTNICFNVFGSTHVETNGKAVERSRFVIVHIDIQHRHILPVILVSLDTEVILHHRRCKLEGSSRFNVSIGKLAVAFHHIVILRTFLESANLHVMEFGWHPGDIRVFHTGIVSVFICIRMRHRIPVDLRFVLAIRGIPHDFGRIRRNITDRHILDIRTLNSIQCCKTKRGLRTIYPVLGCKIVFIVRIDSYSEEIVGSAGFQVP